MNNININMSDKTYDILVLVAQVILPGLGTLYSALAGIWGFPYGEEILSTIVAIDTFLGGFLKFANMQYKKANQ